MSLETQPASVWRFGTFEVDVCVGELRKQGVRIKLQEQPFLVLKVLLARHGGIVSREELRSQIWAADTFVDFDNSLNTAINKLREALGDSADNSRFIETLPRRGYRFIATVTGLNGTTRETSTGVDASARSRKIGVTVAVVALAAVIAGGLLWHSLQAPHLAERDTIVLGDFVNSTGDSVFDGTLREGLSVELEQSPFLNLVSPDEIHQTLRMMERPANSRRTPDHTRSLPTDEQRSSAGRFDCPDRHPIHFDPQGHRLCRRRLAGKHRGAGERQKPRSRRPGEGRFGNAKATWRVFEHQVGAVMKTTGRKTQVEKCLVGPNGLEPSTSSVSRKRSNQTELRAYM
jgi:DNA-binding winged helix-turn-helix (wHTH) protein